MRGTKTWGARAVVAATGPGLVAGAVAGREPRAAVDVAALYQAYRVSLVRLAILLVDDLATAEDVVQDAFVGLCRNGGRLRDADKALGYLRVAVVNGTRSVLRRRRTARGYVGPHQPDHDSAESAVLLAAEHREVLGGLRRLPPRQREVLVLRYWSGLSEAAIADTLGISTGTVKSTASRALDALEQILNEAEETR